MSEKYNSGVDFWTSPHENASDVRFLVEPSQVQQVKQHFRKHKIKAKVFMYSS